MCYRAETFALYDALFTEAHQTVVKDGTIMSTGHDLYRPALCSACDKRASVIAGEAESVSTGSPQCATPPGIQALFGDVVSQA